MSEPSTHVVHGSSPVPPSQEWIPFEWDEPKLGKQVFGEVTVARKFGTSGNLSAGFWRVSSKSPGVAPNGFKSIYSAPLGDETACVIDGTATLTVVSTGKKYKVGPGSIISSPKNLEVYWEIDDPFFKKWWCIWNGSEPTSSPPTELGINNVNDNPVDWIDYHFTQPKEGPLVAGELYFIRSGGSTGTMLSGVWRSGKGIAGSDVDEKGTMTTPYTGVLGDETIFLLEGEVEVVETESGKKHFFKAGDAIGLSSGMHITWISKGPFSKKLWVITNDSISKD